MAALRLLRFGGWIVLTPVTKVIKVWWLDSIDSGFKVTKVKSLAMPVFLIHQWLENQLIDQKE